MNREQQIEQVEVSIDTAKQAVEMMEALERLGKNEDFKKVVTEGYFKNEASRLVLLKADPEMANTLQQETLDKSIIAVGYFRQYLSVVMQLGIQMGRSLKEDEDTLQELLEESL